MDSQYTVLKCSDKKCQEKIDIWPVKPQMNVQSEKPAMKSSNKKSIGLNKNCKATVSSKKQRKCEYDDFQSQSAKCSDKNCQENKRPKKSRSHMQSVTKNTDVQLPKPTVPYAYSRLCKDRNCQSARCYKCPVRPMYSYDKNYQ